VYCALEAGNFGIPTIFVAYFIVAILLDLLLYYYLLLLLLFSPYFILLHCRSTFFEIVGK